MKEGHDGEKLGTNLHDDLQAVLGEDAGRELGAAVRLALVPAVRGEERCGGGVAFRIQVLSTIMWGSRIVRIPDLP